MIHPTNKMGNGENFSPEDKTSKSPEKPLEVALQILKNESLESGKVYQNFESRNFRRLEIPQSQIDEYIALVKSTAVDNIGEIWKNYVIFKDSATAVSMQYSPDQEAYGNWMHQTVKLAVRGLEENNWSFKELLDFLRCARFYISLVNLYGVEKEQPVETPLSTVYKGIYDFYKDYEPDGKTSVAVEQPGYTKFITKSDLNGETVNLSIINLIEKPLTPLYGDVVHTDPIIAKKIMEYVGSELFEKAIKENDNFELTKDLGRIFWWIAQAKPWISGDPSIAETLIRTLWASKGFESLGWKEGVIPWVEVVNEPDVDQFCENFHKLFK